MSLQHISTVIPKALAANAPRPAAPSTTTKTSSPEERPKTLPELVSLFEAIEKQENPDVVMKVSALWVDVEERLMVLSLGGFALTEWSRRQLANLLGCRFDRWFENAAPADRADELN